MFYVAFSFNQPLYTWDVSNVTDMGYMFYSALSFNQDLGKWSVTNVSTMDSMFYVANLSTSNYDNLLIGWSSLPLQYHVEFNAGYSRYSATAVPARNNIINTYSWIITDGGMVASNSTNSMSSISFESNSFTISTQVLNNSTSLGFEIIPFRMLF